MLSGVKFIPRDQVDSAEDEKLDAKRKKSGSRKEKHRKKKNSSNYSSSDDCLERIKKGSRKNKKWYSSDEYSSSESGGSSKQDGKKQRSRKRKSKKSNDDSTGDEFRSRSKKKFSSSKKSYSSEDYSSSGSEYERQKGSTKDERKKGKKGQNEEYPMSDNLSDDGTKSNSFKEKEVVRKEMGLEWMLRPAEREDRRPPVTVDNQLEETPAEETPKANPRELNPYLTDKGSGYPEDADGKESGGNKLFSSSLVGDGGASWRLKALKRSKEQAAREGRKFDEVCYLPFHVLSRISIYRSDLFSTDIIQVVEERWGSLGQLAVSAASHTAAPSRAHLHAIKNRKRGHTEEHQMVSDNKKEKDYGKNTGRDYLRDVSLRHPEMKAPKVHDSLSWGKRRNQKMSTKDAELISSAVSSLNKFSDDGSFLQKVNHQQVNDPDGSYPDGNGNEESELVTLKSNVSSESTAGINEGLSANKLAAKAMQLRMKGKLEEADKLLQEVENMKAKQGAADSTTRQDVGSSNRYVVHDPSVRKKKDDDGDLHLAGKIMQNKPYTLSGRADDEYDFEDGPSGKSRKKSGGNDNKASEKAIAKRIWTQQERCLFCFENPNRPRHLVVAIANFTYLMLPQSEPVVPGHCCILPMQHESATRTVDNSVWDEIRNFKKCLIMMFAKQEKELVFLETVMGLAQQRRHCLIECIPLPQEIAKQAPLYFKKAIDEAEDEWSQHNAKKLIDTSVKGLRGSIPKDFPYFHVEFGLNKGFVHVIDDEKQFKSSLGLNVIRGMLELAEEDMHRRRRHESVEAQKQAVAKFVRDWEPFDWTKQLD
ncbi:hypothetical protein Dsin_029813 [Dipteronia sinensis]|uniref:CWF19-like protein 2 n=1 Tax=Dipteronia sinensis TaxID=43782 RepID=A0AAD9ZUE5_9ROSI|nr:hypothetical protein Dsin_029813 [Dipteronia sinensis]